MSSERVQNQSDKNYFALKGSVLVVSRVFYFCSKMNTGDTIKTEFRSYRYIYMILLSFKK